MAGAAEYRAVSRPRDGAQSKRIGRATRAAAARSALLMTLLVSGLIAGPAEAQMLVRHALSQPLQLALAERALTLCRGRGSEVSVAIADSAGIVRTLISGDGVSAIAIETARRKAKTAALLGFPTSGLVQAAREAPAYTNMLSSLHPDMVFIGGGAPIRRGGELVGGIGVGGARNGDQDEACAREALEALAARIDEAAAEKGR
jgi:uncharacterized protein GlcG (DUF336 family)